jgi:FixJ family two-component response regulator
MKCDLGAPTSPWFAGGTAHGGAPGTSHVPGAPPVVLVVDDDKSVRRSLHRLIGAGGFEVETFASAAEVISSPSLGRPGCLLIDVHLGRMSGFELRDRLAGAGVRMPVIFMTAFDDEPTRARAEAAGAVAYLRKPFDDQALLDAIAKAVAD